MAHLDPSKRLGVLFDRAGDFRFDNNIPLFRYARSTREMERMALVYASEQQYEDSYVLYTKMLRLIVEKVPRHPQYKTVDKEIRATFKKRRLNGFTAADKIKGILLEIFAKEHADYQEEKAQEELLFSKDKSNKEKQNSLEDNKFIITTQEDKHKNDKNITNNEISEDLNKRFENIKTISSYPAVPSVSSNDREQPEAPPPYDSINQNKQSIPPSSYQPSIPTAPPSDIIPDLNNVTTINRDTIPQINRSVKPSLASTPSIDRAKKPETIYQREDSLSSLDGNCRITIPGDLTSKFLQVASPNTCRNLETCGILAGKLSHHQLHISHVIIPKQSATSDSCTTEAEEEMFDIQDKYDLITLGWIHTHPSQTSFLSSVDLHTQCSYQQLMPEAIAIVCAPKFNQTGIYRLTPSYGLNYITKCTKTGFHPHPKNPPLFEDSPLVSIENVDNVAIVDLR